LTKQDVTQTQISTTLTEVLAPPSGKVFLSDLAELKTICAFCIDRNSDRNNFACGEIYRTQIARYKRRFRFGCLGMKSDFSDNKSNAAERYFTQSSVLTESNVLVLPAKELTDNRRGFKDKPSNASSPAFISLSAASSDSSAQSTGSTENQAVEKRSTRLNKLLTDNPHDIASWLELVQCQISEISNDSLAHGSTPARVASATADVQTAILDRALEKNPASIQLKLAQLEVCEGRWDVEKVAAEWKKLVFQHAADPQVWRQYLRYVRSSFRTFSTSRVMTAYVRAVTTLRGARDGTLLSHKAPSNVTTHMIGK